MICHATMTIFIARKAVLDWRRDADRLHRWVNRDRDAAAALVVVDEIVAAAADVEVDDSVVVASVVSVTANPGSVLRKTMAREIATPSRANITVKVTIRRSLLHLTQV